MNSGDFAWNRVEKRFAVVRFAPAIYPLLIKPPQPSLYIICGSHEELLST